MIYKKTCRRELPQVHPIKLQLEKQAYYTFINLTPLELEEHFLYRLTGIKTI